MGGRGIGAAGPPLVEYNCSLAMEHVLQRLDFVRRRSIFTFFGNIWVDRNSILWFSGNSDGSGGQGEVF